MEGCLRTSLTYLPERSFRASPGGNLLEFPQPRSYDRGALVSSSLPSRLSLGGYLAPPVTFGKAEGILVWKMKWAAGSASPQIITISKPHVGRENEQAWKGRGAACSSSCSQSPHDKTVLVRCAQSRATSTAPFSRCLSKEGISLERQVRGLPRLPTWRRKAASSEGVFGFVLTQRERLNPY